MKTKNEYLKEQGIDIEKDLDVGTYTKMRFAMEEYAKDYHESEVEKLRLVAVIPSLHIDRFDAEEWLGENKDIWNHPIVTDRNEKESYEVADLMAEFAMSVLGNEA